MKTIAHIAITEHKSHNRASQSAIAATLLAVLALICAPISEAVSPPPDGGYPNGNTAEGSNALFSLTSGRYNSGLGTSALYSDTTGNSNTAIGWNALRRNTTAPDNTAVGAQALYFNTVGTNNTAVGRKALILNTSSSWNTAIGSGALQSTTGGQNTAVGYAAGLSNGGGFSLCAFGFEALYSNTNGSSNTGLGSVALRFNTTGGGNTAVGESAVYGNTTGNDNTGVGFSALNNNASGASNTAIGSGAGLAATGDGNVYIGANVYGFGGESDTTRIRNVYSSVATARAVYVTADDKLGTLSSSRRYKQGIHPIDRASETLFALRPVSFRYKQEIDPARALSFGLIAEEVAEINSDLITRDQDGNPQTVRYEAVNAMLLNEFLKEHRKVEQQGRQLQKQAVAIASQQKQIEALTSGLQKVNDKVELNGPAPELVENNQ
jgi:hypothetical protein